jgi:peptidoglycan/xylan/chitin deacetylase (PgdA/CDA1 family)
VNPAKLALARLLSASGLSPLLLAAQRWLRSPHIRIVNYHDVPPSRAAAFEAQVRFLAQRFAPVSFDDLVACLRGEWRRTKPGLVFSFDDGLRSHADVAAPILERFGFVGWFFAPVGFIDEPVASQLAWSRAHQIAAAPEFPDPRIALSWDDVRRLGVRHVVGCHTWDHVRLVSTLSRAQLEREIAGAKRRLERELGREVAAFCWVGGEEETYSAEAARAIRAAGFRLGFMTNNALVRPGCDPLQLQRTNLEADFPLEVLRFQISGALDWMYAPKRRRVNRLTGT